MKNDDKIRNDFQINMRLHVESSPLSKSEKKGVRVQSLLNDEKCKVHARYVGFEKLIKNKKQKMYKKTIPLNHRERKT